MEKKMTDRDTMSIAPPTIPLAISLSDAKTEMTKAVNDILKKHNLPCFLFEPILADVYRQVAEGAKKEMMQARADYEIQLQKYEQGHHKSIEGD